MNKNLVLIVGVAVPALAGALLGFAVFRSAAESGESTPEATATGVGIADPLTSNTPSPEITEACEQIETDNAKPRFQGPLGNFEIVGKTTGYDYPCDDLQTSTADSLLSSQLYFAALDQLVGVADEGPTGGPEAGSCGTDVLFIFGQLGAAYVGVFHFFEPLLAVVIDAPEERLSLTEVAGLPALQETSPQQLIPQCDLFIVLRGWSEQQPGIGLAVQGSQSCEEITAIAADFVASYEQAREPTQ